MRKILFLLGMSLILAGVAVAAQASSGDIPCVQETSPSNVSNTVAAASESPDGSNCLECHSNAELLAELAEEDDTPAPPSEGSG
jgi:hypothetical protein